MLKQPQEADTSLDRSNTATTIALSNVSDSNISSNQDIEMTDRMIMPTAEPEDSDISMTTKLVMPSSVDPDISMIDTNKVDNSKNKPKLKRRKVKTNKVHVEKTKQNSTQTKLNQKPTEAAFEKKKKNVLSYKPCLNCPACNNNSNDNVNRVCTNRQPAATLNVQTQKATVSHRKKKPGEKGYRKTGPRERAKRAYDVPKRRKELTNKRILTHGDRIITFMISNATRLPDGSINVAARNQLSRNLQRGMHQAYGFSCKRSKTFIKKWFDYKLEDISREGINFFSADKNYINCGRKYKITPENQMLLTSNFLVQNNRWHPKARSLNKPAVNKQTYSRQQASKFNVSARTIERALERHVEPFKPPRVQPTDLSDAHKEARLAYCKRVIKLGKDYFLKHFAFADEFTLAYNGTVVTHDKIYRLQSIMHDPKYIEHLRKHKKPSTEFYTKKENLNRIKEYYGQVKRATKSDLTWFELYRQSGLSGYQTLLLLDKMSENMRRIRNKTIRRENGLRISFVCFFGYNWKPSECVPMGNWRKSKVGDKYIFEPAQKYSANSFYDSFISRLPIIKKQGSNRSDITCICKDGSTKDISDVTWVFDNASQHVSEGKADDTVDIQSKLKEHKIKHIGSGSIYQRNKNEKVGGEAGYPSWSPDFMPVEMAIFPTKHKAYNLLAETSDEKQTQKEQILLRVKQAWESVSQDTLNSYIDHVWANMEACIAAKGDFGERVLTRTKKT